MDTVEKPTIASFVKKKQCEELNPADLVSVRQDCRPVRKHVQPNCIPVVQKYLSERASQFFRTVMMLITKYPITCVHSDNTNYNIV